MKWKTEKYNFILSGLFVLMAGLIVAWKLPKREDCYIHMGIAVYDLNDTFMEKYIRTLQDMIEKTEIAGRKISYEIYNADGKNKKQEKQLQYMYAQEYDIMLVNLVEPASAASVLNEAEEKEIPVILYNREVAEKDLQIVKDVWYVGTDGKAAGEIQGKLLKELWDKQKQSVDRNQNGKLDYILIEGEESHYDTIRRTNGFLESGRELPLKQLGNLTADWKREIALEKFAKLDEETIRNTEAVVCNNDDMALGVYDYYKKHQMKLPVIIGINNSQEMNQKIRLGEIYGTVDNNMEDQAARIYEIMKSVLNGVIDKYDKIWYSMPYEIVNSDISEEK